MKNAGLNVTPKIAKLKQMILNTSPTTYPSEPKKTKNTVEP